MARNIIDPRKMITNSLHKKIISELKKISGSPDKKQRLWVQKYLGSNKPTKCISSKEIVNLSKQVLKENTLTTKQFSDLLDSLYSKGGTFEELFVAARLLEGSSKIRQEITPQKLDYWLNFTQGWAEIDVLCQSNFPAQEVLGKWNLWKKILIKFSKDKKIAKRRASIVLLVTAVRESNDKKLSDLAFKNVDLLKKEKEILITKAISWILRSLIKNHKKEVAEYLKKNQNSLPRIAIRETTNKLLTGTKKKV